MLVAALTLLSVAAYVAEWVRHMNSVDGRTMSRAPANAVATPRPAAVARRFQRQMMFWLAALAVFILVLWLLSEILLPFIAGLAIAYLLTPLTDRLERLGVNRLAASLLIITVVVLAFVVIDPADRADPRRPVSPSSTTFPATSTKLQSLLSDQSRPWVQKLLGAGFSPDKAFRRSGDAGRRLAHHLP